MNGTGPSVGGAKQALSSVPEDGHKRELNKTLPIDELLQSLEELEGAVEESLRHLVERLYPVMRPLEVTEQGKLGEEVTGSPTGLRLRSLINRKLQLIDALDELTVHIDL